MPDKSHDKIYNRALHIYIYRIYRNRWKWLGLFLHLSLNIKPLHRFLLQYGNASEVSTFTWIYKYININWSQHITQAIEFSNPFQWKNMISNPSQHVWIHKLLVWYYSPTISTHLNSCQPHSTLFNPSQWMIIYQFRLISQIRVEHDSTWPQVKGQTHYSEAFFRVTIW